MCIMKKGLLVLMVFLLSGAMALYGKRISNIVRAKPETKTVRFLVYAGTDYSPSLYKKSNATVTMTIYRFKNDGREVIWEGIIGQRSVKSFPSPYNAVYREVSVHNVYDRVETIAASYKVTYDYKGSDMSYEEAIPLSEGSKADSLRIAI